MSLASSSCASSKDDSQAETSDPNFVDGQYVNNHIQHPNKSIFAYLKLRWFGDDEWADHEAAKGVQFPKLLWILTSYCRHRTSDLDGALYVLIQWQGKTILTDPVFSERASPVSFAGPKRYTKVTNTTS